MKIIAYSPRNHDLLPQLEALTFRYPDCDFAYTRDDEGFRRAVSFCLEGESLIIFLVYQKRDMALLESIVASCWDPKLFVHVAVDDDSLVNRAHALCPRLVSTKNSSSQLLPAALEKVIKNSLTL